MLQICNLIFSYTSYQKVLERMHGAPSLNMKGVLEPSINFVKGEFLGSGKHKISGLFCKVRILVF